MHDVIIIGAGPAGLTASIYLARANKKVLVLEKETIGGQMASSPLIENYPGYNKISGGELALQMYNQAVDLGVDIELEKVLKIDNDSVITEDNEYKAKAIIIATGAKYRKLGLENEEKLIGKGIHFCASCDGAFYKNKVVVIIGGANTAVVNALYLSDIASKVYLIYRKDKLKCENILKEKVKNAKNITILYNTTVEKINGEDKLQSIIIKTPEGQKELKVSAMFEAIGMDAETEIAKNILSRDERNYFIHDNTKTKYANIFVAGDCITKEVRQISTAISDGAIAATNVINYLNK